MLCLAICSVFLLGTATAQQSSAPVLKQTPTVAAKPAGTTTPVPSVLTPALSETLKKSRALLNGLRKARNAATVPASPGSTQKLQTNDILLTSEEDEFAEVVSISSMSLTLNESPDGPLTPVPAPPMPNTDENAGVVSSGESSQTYAAPQHYSENQYRYGANSSSRKQRRKSRSFHDRITRWTAGMIEFYDPEFEEPYDTDDYEMKILLVSEEEEESPDKVTAEEPQGSGLLSRKISDIKPSLDYAWGAYTDAQLPDDFHERMDNGAYVAKLAPRTVLQWAPSNLWYHPLYFEDPGLERYGHTRHPVIQPFASTGRFFGQVVGLPYQVALHPFHSREYALGYYQPGEWAPKKKYQIPFNEEAAASEFLWITALILLIP